MELEVEVATVLEVLEVVEVVVVLLVSWLMAMSRCGVWQSQCVASGGC